MEFKLDFKGYFLTTKEETKYNTYLNKTNGSLVREIVFLVMAATNDPVGNRLYLPSQCLLTALTTEDARESYKLTYSLQDIAYNHPEEQYLDKLERIRHQGNFRTNSRTAENDYNIFGQTMDFDLSFTVPLMTHKRVAWKTCIKELLWFLKGDTSNLSLQQQGVKIWNDNANSQRQTSLQVSNGLLPGDLGPIYGFQWRHAGATYIDADTDYTGQGVDQISNIINLIKNDPGSRRIILNAWSPSDVEKCVLPPCHMFAQFYVDQEAKTLSCQMYQRSADMLLGVPFNVFSYAVLTMMIAQVCDLTPGMFHWTGGDCHVYENHSNAVETFISRDPTPSPLLKINPDVKNIDDFEIQDFELFGYFPRPNISNIPMAI